MGTTGFPKRLHLKKVISPWKDDCGRRRIHILLAMLSGTRVQDLEYQLLEDGYLELTYSWPAEMFFAWRLLTHSRFVNEANGVFTDKPYYTRRMKWQAVQEVLDRGMGGEKVFKSTITIKLPASNYQFTPPDISGHHEITLANLEKDPDAPPKTSILCLFDLVAKDDKEHQKLSRRPIYDDDDAFEFQVIRDQLSTVRSCSAVASYVVISIALADVYAKKNVQFCSQIDFVHQSYKLQTM